MPIVGAPRLGAVNDTQKIFKLIETADNFIKYSRPGGEDGALNRARKRYEKAQRLAETAGDAQILEQLRVRMEDLDRRASQGAGHSAAQGSEEEPQRVEDEEQDASVVTRLEDVPRAPLPQHASERVPPGQRVTGGWPVLHEGPIPRFDPATWSLRVAGDCRRPLELSYDELKRLPNAELQSDFHCVTGWSKLDNLWRGVKTKVLLEVAQPNGDARFVTVGAEYGYTANLPLDVLWEDESMVVWSHNGRDLAPKHGYPLRLLIPRLYAWKSVKWVRSVELMTADRRGFWEVRGYHNRADPWLEERYSYQETR